MILSSLHKAATAILAAACITAATTAAATEYAPASRLSEGRWLKVRVHGEGIQEISHAQLRAWGFDDPARVRVYGYGATALTLDRLSDGADDLPPTPTMHTGDGRMLFYADGDSRFDLRNITGTHNIYNQNTTLWRHNVYDTGACYFLSDVPSAYEAPTVEAPTDEGETVYVGHFHVDARDIDRMAPIQGGNIFCERAFTAADPVVAEMHVHDAIGSELKDGPQRDAVFTYSCFISLAALEKVYNSPEPILVSTDGAAAGLQDRTSSYLDRFSMADYNSLSGTITFAGAGAMPEGALTVTLSPPAAATAGLYCLDRHALIYPRLNRLPDGEAMMLLQYHEAQRGAAVRIAGYRPGMQLWDVSDPAAVSVLELRPDGGGNAVAAMPADFSSAAPGRLVLFDPAARHMEPELVGTLEPQNLHALKVPDMLIITTDDCEPEARRLAEAHGSIDGLSVAVCRSREIYNEFGGGVATPAAYRRMAHMLYSRDPERFRYVLLLGSSTHDMRELEDIVPHEVLAVHEAALGDARLSLSSAYASDSYVGWMRDNKSFTDFSRARMDVAVGRLPARNPGEARAMVNHTIDYMQHTPDSRHAYRAVMGSGLGDKYEHYLYSAATTAALRRYGVSVFDVPMIAYGNTTQAATQLHGALREGCGFFCYYGHAAGGNLVGEAAYYSTDIINSLSYNVYPMAMLATCNTFQIDCEQPCAASAMLMKERGGAIAVIAATRSVFSSYNHLLAMAVAEAYAKGRPGETTGDIYRRGHNAIVGGNTLESACFNAKCYNLCGDPAVRLPFAHAGITLESCTESGAGEDVMPRGDALVTLGGYVDGDDGEPDTDFNGTARIEIFDTPVPGTVMRQDAGNLPEIELENIRLALGNARVENGRWRAEMYVPPFSNPGREFAIAIDATADDGRSAHALYSGLPSGGNSDGAGVDDGAPVIAEMYIDSPDFTDGGSTGPDIRLHARLQVPPSGLGLADVALRPTSRVELDGSASATGISGYCMPAADGSGDMLLSVPFGGLTEGRHSLRLSVAGGMGAHAERSLSFVVHSPVQALLAVEGDGPCFAEAVFALNHDLTGDADARIIISDSAGHTVRTLRGTTVWDLADDGGEPVADGVYRAHALLSATAARTHSNTVELVVIRDRDMQ